MELEVDASFIRFIKRRHISTETAAVLAREGVTDKDTFCLLGEQHMEKLFTQLPLGEHAKLVKAKDELSHADDRSTPFKKPGLGNFVELSIIIFKWCLRKKKYGKQLEASSSSDGSLTSGLGWSGLWAKYKGEQRDKIKHMTTKAKPKKSSGHFHLGGMVYDYSKKRGIRRKSIPSPEEVEFPFIATYKDVVKKGRSIFFDNSVPLTALVIADSNGSEISTQSGSDEEWTLGEFFAENSYKPSRFKLYIMYCPSKDNTTDTVASDSEQSSDDGFGTTSKKSKVMIPCDEKSNDKKEEVTTTRKTDAIKQPCQQCSIEFFTFIPDTLCKMPDGSTVFYQQPQELCPKCDEHQFGWAWNTKLEDQ